MQSGKKWHILSESGRVDGQKKTESLLFWKLFTQMPCFSLPEQKPLQRACPPVVPAQTLQMNCLQWPDSIRQPQSHSRSCELLNFPDTHEYSCREASLLWENLKNNDEAVCWHKSPPIFRTLLKKESMHNKSILRSDVKTTFFIHFWMDTSCLSSGGSHYRASKELQKGSFNYSPVKQKNTYLTCSACGLFCLSRHCLCTLQQVISVKWFLWLKVWNSCGGRLVSHSP